ncbi:M20 family metallopeptidase [Serratia sp. DD3]|uniref:M20 metallopeptidase family protein n=1 Tax=Serratia sp. DD3 TaxID=1410619 RepID=UPI0003C512D6|nr:amidohydrolase [Serratia sp. DD3]KEY58614.1 putative hydrolase YxeP [Serratia sp. DD3]
MMTLDWKATEKRVIGWRRDLHRHPELSHQEHWTTGYLIEQLATFDGIDITTPAPTGVVAYLRGKHPGPTIALRADIDALPVVEQNHRDFDSQQPGVMHACGHDGHSAMLLGAAALLSQLRDQLAGEVIFIFQRGEEMSPGGAKELVDSGCLDQTQMFFALHLQPNLPSGQIEIKPGIATANRDTFHIEITGRGGHSSMPQLSIDPIVASAAVVGALQSIVAREIDPRDAAVVSLCSLLCGDGSTARLPDSASLCGTTRSFTPQVREHLRTAMTRICHSTAQAYRCKCDIRFDEWDYSAINNDPQLCELAGRAARLALGAEAFHLAALPMSVGEDFSEYQQIAPVCFAWLGVGEAGANNAALHNACFSPDERALIAGVRYYLQLAQQTGNLTAAAVNEIP